MHEKYLPERYFPLVGAISRHPRYKNKRTMDPQVKCYLDEKDLCSSEYWGLPVPNAEAAYKSLAKYGKDILFMTNKQVRGMNQAWMWTEKHFYPYMGNSRVRTLEEVIAKLDMQTSTGAPFNLFYPTKAEIFEACGPLIMEWLKDDWEVLANDPLWTCLCTNSLKEEIRPTEKTLLNKIRTFTAMALDLTVHGNRLFADMNERMNDSHLKTASMVGMSPYEGNWNRMFHKLNVFKNGYALDESEYDSSLRNYLMWGCAKLRWSMLRSEDRTPENLQRLKTIYRNLINSLVISPDGVLVLKLTGNPSGSPNTINDNTLILYTLMAYAWIMNCPNEPNYEEFEDNTAKVLVGDDNTWTVSDYAHPFYNARTVIAEWKLIGVTTTTDCLEPRLAEELDFLSAHTVFLKGQAIPVYDRDKLMTSMLYAPRKHLTPATTLQRAAALLTVGWTDIPFRKFCRELIDWLLLKYDKTMAEDEVWILAKCGILSDERLFHLFMGKTELYLDKQGFNSIRKRRKIMKPNKLLIMNSLNQNNVNSGSKRRNRKRGNKGRNPQAIRTKTEVIPWSRESVAIIKKRKQVKKRRNRKEKDFTGLATKNATPSLSKEFIVSEDEFLLDVTTLHTDIFEVLISLGVNPGNATLFPWLARLAQNYEKYEFEYLTFYFKHAVSQFNAQGAAGKLIMAFDTDAADGPPGTKTAMEDMLPHADSMMSQDLFLNIPRSLLRPKYMDARFIRHNVSVGSNDIKTYDVGNFHLAASGLSNVGNVGELHVKYRVRLMVPRLSEAVELAPNNRVCSMWQGAVIPVSGGPLAAIASWQDITDGGGANNGVTNDGESFNFTGAPGNYMITCNVNLLNSSGIRDADISISKNGAEIVPATYRPRMMVELTSVTDYPTEFALTQTVFVHMNSNDNIRISQQCTFNGGGTPRVYATAVLQAV